MNRWLRDKYQTIRKQFKDDLYTLAKSNSAIPILIMETYTASQCRTHITKIWELLGFHHKEAYKDYCDKLVGQALTGRSEIMRSLHFADKPLYDKYYRKIPECYAMGDAVAIAYRVQRESRKKGE